MLFDLHVQDFIFLFKMLSKVGTTSNSLSSEHSSSFCSNSEHCDRAGETHRDPLAFPQTHRQPTDGFRAAPRARRLCASLREVLWVRWVGQAGPTR